MNASFGELLRTGVPEVIVNPNCLSSLVGMMRRKNHLTGELKRQRILQIYGYITERWLL